MANPVEREFYHADVVIEWGRDDESEVETNNIPESEEEGDADEEEGHGA
jgi:hypothetical protein